MTHTTHARKPTKAALALAQLHQWAVAHETTVLAVETLSNARLHAPETHCAYDARLHLLAIAKGGCFEEYDVTEFDVEEGRGFTLWKLCEPEMYEAFVPADLEHRGCLCNCRGHEFSSVCKHTQVLPALIADGQL